MLLSWGRVKALLCVDAVFQLENFVFLAYQAAVEGIHLNGGQIDAYTYGSKNTFADWKTRPG